MNTFIFFNLMSEDQQCASLFVVDIIKQYSPFPPGSINKHECFLPQTPFHEYDISFTDSKNAIITVFGTKGVK